MDVEEHIRRAIEQGKFDDLPGKGRPADLNENPLADQDWRLAFHMLKSAGYSLPWIEQLQELDAEIEAARAELRRGWEWRSQALQSDTAGSGTDQARLAPAAVEAEWQRLVQVFKERIESINKHITDINLQVPLEMLQRSKLNSDKEVEYVTQIKNGSRH